MAIHTSGRNADLQSHQYLSIPARHTRPMTPRLKGREWWGSRAFGHGILSRRSLASAAPERHCHALTGPRTEAPPLDGDVRTHLGRLKLVGTKFAPSAVFVKSSTSQPQRLYIRNMTRPHDDGLFRGGRAAGEAEHSTRGQEGTGGDRRQTQQIQDTCLFKGQTSMFRVSSI